MNKRPSFRGRPRALAVLVAGVASSLGIAAWNTSVPAHPAASPADTVEIFWDLDGVPHISSATNKGAYFGMGYACARDRLGQMLFARLRVYGRLAEFFEPWNADEPGYDPLDPEQNAYLASDIRLRTLGTKRLATLLANEMDSQTKRLIDAYAAGIEQYVSELPSWPPSGLPPAFDHQGLATVAANWQAQHVIALWLEFSEWLSGFPLGETQDDYYVGCGGDYSPGPPSQALIDCINEATNVHIAYDECAAVVQMSDMAAVPGLLDAIDAYAAAYGGGEATYSGHLDPNLRASQAWAVGSDLMQNGLPEQATLFGHPQILVELPGYFWESDVTAGQFRVRGAQVPGTGNFWVGSNEHVAWTATALVEDQSDLFWVELDPNNPEHYLLDLGNGVESLAWDVDVTEQVKVYSPPPGLLPTVPVRYRQTWWGPVIPEEMLTEPENGFPANRVYCMRGVLFARPHLNPQRGFFEVYKSTTAEEVRLAFGGGALNPNDPDSNRGGVAYPKFNCVFADRDGKVGYCPVGSIPLRNPNAPLGGALPMDGSSTANDWVDIIPHDYKPWKIDTHYAYSANHLNVGEWYPLPFGGSGGFTYRARRLWERLEALSTQTTPADVFDIYKDTVLIRQRDFVRLGRALLELGYDDDPNLPGVNTPYPFHQDALLALGATYDSQAGQWTYASDRVGDWAGDYLYANQSPTDNNGRFGLLPQPHPANAIADNLGEGLKFNVANLNQALIDEFGNNEHGLNYWMHCKLDALNGVGVACPAGTCNVTSYFTADEADYIHQVLCEAWYRANQPFTTTVPPEPECTGSCCGWNGPVNSSLWWDWFINERLHGVDPFLVDLWRKPLLGVPPLADPANDYPVLGPFESVAIYNLMSQKQQSYSQFVRLGANVTAPVLSICPLGQSERSDDIHYDDQVPDWVGGELRPSPMISAPFTGLTGSTSPPVNPLTLTYDP